MIYIIILVFVKHFSACEDELNLMMGKREGDIKEKQYGMTHTGD